MFFLFNDILEYMRKAIEGVADLYLTTTLLFGVLTIALVLFEKFRAQKAMIFLLVLYIYLMFTSNVIARQQSYKETILEPLWSYKKAIAGDWHYSHEIIENIILFIPIGMILGLMFSFSQHLGRNTVLSVLIFIIISALIEIFQGITHSGQPETDDVISNTVGGMLAYFITIVLFKMKNYYKQKRTQKI